MMIEVFPLATQRTVWDRYSEAAVSYSTHCRGDAVISNDEELHQAETAVQKLWRFLAQARQTHACADYERLAAPYLLQIQDRQQEILAYLSTRPEVLRA
ncbi:MAG: hypothetical protein ACREIJ_09600 [Nitrospiraceae bacterium]